ncbi:MAG: hypothetical protein R6X21_02945, partial [Candidatus Aminicenantes bacterium]
GGHDRSIRKNDLAGNQTAARPRHGWRSGTRAEGGGGELSNAQGSLHGRGGGNYKTMEVADYIYGTTMPDPNMTKLLSVKLERKSGPETGRSPE